MSDSGGSGAAAPPSAKARSSTPLGTARTYAGLATTVHASYPRSATPGSSGNFYNNVRGSILNNKTKRLLKSCTAQENQAPWRPGRRTFDVGYGYQKSWRSARSIIPGSRQTCVEKEAKCPTSEWKPTIRCYENQHRRTSEEITYKPGRKCSARSTPLADSQEEQWKPSRRVIHPQNCPTEWTFSANRRHFRLSMSEAARDPQISHKSAGIQRPATWDFGPPKGIPPPGEHSKQCARRQYFCRHPPLRLFSIDGDTDAREPCSYTIFPQKKWGKKSVPEYDADHPHYRVCSSELDAPCGLTL